MLKDIPQPPQNTNNIFKRQREGFAELDDLTQKLHSLYEQDESHLQDHSNEEEDSDQC
jgi:hypothetical protein